jgi:hypothetical protein
MIKTVGELQEWLELLLKKDMVHKRTPVIIILEGNDKNIEELTISKYGLGLNVESTFPELEMDHYDDE